MARQAHLEAAKHHLEAASMHLDVAGQYRDGNREEAERQEEVAWAASKVAEEKSAEAHGEFRKTAAENLVWVANSVAGRAAEKDPKS
jgi:hypothetical protein